MKALLWMMLAYSISLNADVKSETGSIKFNIDSQGQHEAELTQTGLGIGINASTNLHVSGNGIVSSKISIGGDLSENTLQVNGSMSLNPLLSSGGNVTLTDHSLLLVNTGTTDATVQLPPVAQSSGRYVKIKKQSTGGNLFITSSGNLIDLETTLIVPPDTNSSLPSLTLICDGEQWWVLNYNGPTSEAVGSANLLIHYKLDELSGVSASDETSFSRTATLQNNHSFSGNSVSSPQQTGLRLDEKEDQLNYNHGGELLSNTYSWALWMNSSIDPETSPTINPAEPGLEVIGFNWTSDNTQWQKAAFHKQSDGSFVRAQISTDLSINTWYHIAATWDGSTLKAYLNGSLEASTATSSIKTSGGNLNISNPGSESSSTTSLDVFQLFDRALSAEEVNALFSAGNP